jgi:hypothetical protein
MANLRITRLGHGGVLYRSPNDAWLWVDRWTGAPNYAAAYRTPEGPIGVVGLINLLGLGPQATRPPLGIDILYGGLIGEGMYQIIFEPPPDTTRTELLFWSDVSGAKLEAATVEEGTLDGKPVSIGTIFLDPALDYSFVATAEGDSLRTVSTVGGIEVKQ